MTLEEQRVIEKWLAQKEKNRYARLIIDRWHSKELGCNRVNLAYWFQVSADGKEYRINKAGNTIEEVALECMLQESDIRIDEKRGKKC